MSGVLPTASRALSSIPPVAGIVNIEGIVNAGGGGGSDLQSKVFSAGHMDIRVAVPQVGLPRTWIRDLYEAHTNRAH